ncbi:EI24 domain-containing protein [Thermodesulfobacteriota bacterium B35]
MTQKKKDVTSAHALGGTWVPLSSSLMFLVRHVKLLALGLLLVLLTGLLTWIGYLEAIDFIDSLTGHFFQQPPAGEGVLGWLLAGGWLVLKYVFVLVTRVVAFYLAFLLAYCLTTPGYVFLSNATEKIYLGGAFPSEGGFTVAGVITDLVEGIKIGAVGILVTVVALFANFIPVIGQGVVFLIYTFYSALMFVDYPASSLRWSLGRKIRWVVRHRNRSFRLGLLPALVSMVPLVNIFFMALLFPLFTVHTTLNFMSVEAGEASSLPPS